MELVIGLGVIIAVVLLWAYRVDRRRRREPLTSHNQLEAGRRARITGEQKGSEWGGGGW